MTTDPLAALETADPLAALSAEPAMLPSVGSDDVPPPPLPEAATQAARIVELEAELAAANARITAQAERIQSLEGSKGIFGSSKRKARIAELEARLEELSAALAASKAQKKSGEENLLPVVARAQHDLAVITQERDEATMGMITLQHEVAAANRQLGEMEFERDERDSLLRKTEAEAANDKQRLRSAQEQLALARAATISKTDPGKGKAKGVAATRLRLQAALGNMSAMVELGGEYLDNTCTFCKASPACAKTRLLSWPHGSLVPRTQQNFLLLLVQEAQAHGADPYLALEAWAEGMDGEEVVENIKAGAYRIEVEELDPESLTGFAKRLYDRVEADEAEREVAEMLRTLRCKECQQTLLWHKDGAQPKRSPDVCDLDQKSVFERVNLKSIRPMLVQPTDEVVSDIKVVQPMSAADVMSGAASAEEGE